MQTKDHSTYLPWLVVDVVTEFEDRLPCALAPRHQRKQCRYQYPPPAPRIGGTHATACCVHLPYLCVVYILLTVQCNKYSQNIFTIPTPHPYQADVPFIPKFSFSSLIFLRHVGLIWPLHAMQVTVVRESSGGSSRWPSSTLRSRVKSEVRFINSRLMSRSSWGCCMKHQSTAAVG